MPNYIPSEAEWYLDEYDAERFWRRVNFKGGQAYASDRLATAEGDCWLFSPAKDDADYGRFQATNKWAAAHRVAFKDFGNKLPDDKQLDHLCRIHNCVRPSHLEPVTAQENMRRGLRANQTHCKNGHEFTEANTRISGTKDKPFRLCRACRKEYAAKQYQRRKNAA